MGELVQNDSADSNSKLQSSANNTDAVNGADNPQVQEYDNIPNPVDADPAAPRVQIRLSLLPTRKKKRKQKGRCAGNGLAISLLLLFLVVATAVVFELETFLADSR